MNLTYADELYVFSSRALKIEQHPVPHQDLKSFTDNLRNFESRLGEDKIDSYWQPKLRLLKRYRFRLYSVPVGFDNPDKNNLEDIGGLFKHVEKCKLIFPQYADDYKLLVEQASLLTTLSDRPLLDKITSLKPDKDAAILIKEPRFISELEEIISKNLNLRHVEVVTAPQLRYQRTYSEIYIIGSMRWFPDYVITASRARTLHLVHYSFLSSYWEPGIFFITQKEPKIFVRNSSQVEIESISAEEILPAIDWDAVASSYAEHVNQSGDDQEFVDAKLVILEDNNAIFLEKNANELIIDSRFELQRIKVNELEPNMFLIAREKGSGDYIIPIANKILGEAANKVREAQSHWKSKLRKAVLLRGMEAVEIGLKRMGARSASKVNIRNWMSRSARKIRPQEKQDFKAIMFYLDLMDDVEDYWKTSGMIKKAHIKAGRKMTELLKLKVQESNLDLLEQRGYQQFALADYETSLHVFRIIEIRKNNFRIPLSKVAEVLEL